MARNYYEVINKMLYLIKFNLNFTVFNKVKINNILFYINNLLKFM